MYLFIVSTYVTASYFFRPPLGSHADVHAGGTGAPFGDRGDDDEGGGLFGQRRRHQRGAFHLGSQERVFSEVSKWAFSPLPFTVVSLCACQTGRMGGEKNKRKRKTALVARLFLPLPPPPLISPFVFPFLACFAPPSSSVFFCLVAHFSFPSPPSSPSTVKYVCPPPKRAYASNNSPPSLSSSSRRPIRFACKKTKEEEVECLLLLLKKKKRREATKHTLISHMASPASPSPLPPFSPPSSAADDTVWNGNPLLSPLSLSRSLFLSGENREFSFFPLLFLSHHYVGHHRQPFIFRAAPGARSSRAPCSSVLLRSRRRIRSRRRSRTCCCPS